MTDTIFLENRHTSGVYAKRDVTIVRGQGAILYDEQGRAYIDCVGGQGVAGLGHAHPAIVEAIANQARTLISCPEMFYNDRRAALLARLAGLPPGNLSRVFLSNSGTEAIESALKFARLSTGRTGIVAAMRGFHGRTFGALSATWDKKYREPFEPLVPGFQHVPYNQLDKMEQVVGDDTAAVILEVIQGEGGVHPGSREYLQGVEELCRQRGALFILDEIQTGLGRTGKMLALEHHDLNPDMVCLAKSLAGGLPIGAVLLGDRVGELPTGAHGSTFGGNPMAAAAALATLEVLENEQLPARAASLGARLIAQLEALDSPLVREVRGLGLMVGIEIKQKVAPYLSALMERGVLALPAGLTVIRLLPPLVIREEQLDRVVETLAEVLA
jgi:acetylornithine/LysW-gamma-L-lysine aminotransferase